jgi:hypothetical protein
MSLVGQLSALATRIGVEIQGLVRPDHPALAKAWVSFGWVGGVIVLYSAWNIASVSRLTAGVYRITFLTPMPDADYAWLAFARSTGNTGAVRLALARATSDAKTPAYLDVSCATASGALADTSEMNVVVFG